MKYSDIKVTFSEVPEEVTLCISISECPGTCDGCHSPWLRDNTGESLTKVSVYELLESNKGVSCICFMGGDGDIESLCPLVEWTKKNYPEIKTAWYSGLEELKDNKILQHLDYLKLGSYKKELGPLNSPTTNQRFYQVIHTPVPSTILVDITHKFWKEAKDENSSL